MDATDLIDLTPALNWAAETIGMVESVQELTGGWTSTMLAIDGASGDTAVLRLMTRDLWRSHGRALTTREARVQAIGRSPEPYFDVMDLKGFLPPPGKKPFSFLDERLSQERFEQRLRRVLSRLGT